MSSLWKFRSVRFASGLAVLVGAVWLCARSTARLWGDPPLAAAWDHPLLYLIWLGSVPLGVASLGALLTAARVGEGTGLIVSRRMVRIAVVPLTLFFACVLVWLTYLLNARADVILPDPELGGFLVWLKTYVLLLPAGFGAIAGAMTLVPALVSHDWIVRMRGGKEWCVRWLLTGCALLTVLTTAGIIIVLIGESAAFFREVSLSEFLLGTEWTALFDNAKFGVWPLVAGTVLVAGIALLVAVPIGIGAAIFLSEYAPPAIRGMLKPILEILAGVPTVVYGFFALQFVTPHIIRPLLPDTDTFNALSAGLVVGVMIIPTISSLCDDALRAVPRSLREAAYALSATRLEVSFRIVLPAALSGVTAAILLALARAIGETMAVAMAAGMTPNLTANPLKSIQTMTSYIVQVSLGDTPAGTVRYYSIFAVGLTLFVMTLLINLIATRVMNRFREAYE